MPRIQVFTDGSCITSHSDDPGAWAYIIRADGERHAKHGSMAFTTCNRMELAAAIHALDFISRHYGPSDVVIYSDSQYLCDSASKYLEGWVRNNWRNSARKSIKNLALWKKLHDELKDHIRVDFNWIPSHNKSFPDNGAVDRMAYTAACRLRDELDKKSR